jgi:hypothetical protein
MIPMIIGAVTRPLAARFLSKRITDSIISGKINEFTGEARGVISRWYENYLSNLVLSIVLNVVMIALSITSYLFFPGSKVIIIAISLITVFMMARWIINTIISIVRDIYPHLSIIQDFIKNLISTKSLSFSIKWAIRMEYRKIYEANTNGIGRFAHSAASLLGFVKSADDIGDDVVDEFYILIKDYLLRVIIYKISAFLVFYGIFIMVLKPIVFSYTMNIGFLKLLVFPFTIGIPAGIEIVKGWVL